MMKVKERLAQLMLEYPTQTGSGLGKLLGAEGFNADQAIEALLDKGFTVQKRSCSWGTILHISRKPMEDGIQVIFPRMGDSGEVAWHDKPQSTSLPANKLERVTYEYPPGLDWPDPSYRRRVIKKG